jgi:hypothetical protein
MLKSASHMDSVKKLKVKEKDLVPSQEHYEVGAFWFGGRKLKLMETVDGASKSERLICSDIESDVMPVNRYILSLLLLLSCSDVCLGLECEFILNTPT